MWLKVLNTVDLADSVEYTLNVSIDLLGINLVLVIAQGLPGIKVNRKH